MSAVVGNVGRRRVAVAGSSSHDTGLALAWNAYGRAAYGECRGILRALDGRSGPARAELALLEARCAREEGDLAAWTAAADSVAAAHPDPARKLEGLALRALAHREAGRSAQADRDVKAVRAIVDRDGALAAGFATYFVAYDAWQCGELDEAETLANVALSAGDVRPFATALLGACAVARDRASKAAAYFAEALRDSRARPVPSLHLGATILCDASELARATIDLKLAKKIKRDFDEFSWPHELVALRVRALANFRAIALLEGDLDRAWFLSREATAFASDGAGVILGETNAAVASRLLGDERSARLQLARAFEAVRTHRLDGNVSDARVALATFAREAASDMPGEARKAMATYESLSPRDVRGVEVAAPERRMRALGAMAHGRIAEVRGNYDAAFDRYTEAFEAWRELHDLARAALVALDLQRLARDPHYDETLDAALARAPQAWFAPQASPAAELLGRLTPAETLVLGALLGGKSARAIADGLDRSVHTINNHTRKIFAAFGVTSRAAVLARCAEVGITPASLARIA